MTMDHHTTRRVVLLQTDERAGLVAAIADACAARGISLEIATGPGHVLISLAMEETAVEPLLAAFRAIPGVASAHPYTVEDALT
jgi:hypothetical protein